MVEISVQDETAIQDLLVAFEDETNAQARYLAFATKADAEKLHGAASLCRAAAWSEHIHAASHARAIKQLGIEAWCTLQEVTVKNTLENMRDALGGEQREIDDMYPGALEEARKHRNHAVIRTFVGALESEKAHAKLYAEAAALIAAGKTDSWIGAAQEFYVCPTCGYTSKTHDEDDYCPVCHCSQERFEAVQ
jgi:rubrerythrin